VEWEAGGGVRKVGMKVFEENTVPGIENERGAQRERPERRGGSRRGDDVGYKQG